jgi:hypothetical protein
LRINRLTSTLRWDNERAAETANDWGLKFMRERS